MFSLNGRLTELCNMDIKMEIKEEPLHLERTSSEKNVLDQSEMTKTDVHNTSLLKKYKNNVCTDSKMDTNIEIKDEFQFCLETSNKTQSHIVDTAFKSEIDCAIASSISDIVAKKGVKDDLWCLESNSSKIKPKSEQTLQCDLKNTAPCIMGIDEDFPLIQSARACMEEVQSDSRYVPPMFVNAAFEDGLSITEDYTTKNAYQLDSKMPHQSDSVYLKQNFMLASASKKHENKRPHKCKICQKSFRFLSRLKIHNFIHSDKGSYECKICGKIVAHLWQLQLHKYTHEGKKLHKCRVCDKSFNKMYCLKRHCVRRHNLVHQSRKTYKCEICDKIFTKMSNLKRHSFTHEGKRPYKCEICGKTFARESDSKAHNLMHVGESPYKCSICLKTFTRASNLKRHSLTHENKRLHKCEICEKGFQDVSHLKRHGLIHAGIKPYKCNICKKGFTQLTHLKRHNETHHK